MVAGSLKKKKGERGGEREWEEARGGRAAVNGCFVFFFKQKTAYEI